MREYQHRNCWLVATSTIGLSGTGGVMMFDPPGEEQEGNDWVLVMENDSRRENL